MKRLFTLGFLGLLSCDDATVSERNLMGAWVASNPVAPNGKTAYRAKTMMLYGDQKGVTIAQGAADDSFTYRLSGNTLTIKENRGGSNQMEVERFTGDVLVLKDKSNRRTTFSRVK